MKVIEINSKINLTTDSTIPPGAIAIIYQSSASPFNKKMILGIEYIPFTVIISVYISLAAYVKLNIQPQPPETIKDFGTIYTDVLISVSDYETISNESNAIAIAFDQLNEVYPGNVTILNL